MKSNEFSVLAMHRREAMAATIASIGLSALCYEPAQAATAPRPDSRRGSPKRYSMKKSINSKKVTYDFARLMEGATQVSCSGFGQVMIDHM